jgi:N-formylglutamate amidohydrolase
VRAQPLRLSRGTPDAVDVFELKVSEPPAPLRPLLVEIPHAGLNVPEAIRHELLAPEDALMRDADIYVDRLYEHAPRAGATLLVAKLSRYVVDLNRARDDLDAATVSGHPASAGTQPRGVVWRATTDGRPVLLRPLGRAELNNRLERYYAPYHQVLQLNLERLRAQFGYVIVLAAHSMPSLGRSTHRDPGAQRADVVPGTCGRTSADPRVIDLVDMHFRAAGLRVRHDDPYKGGYTTSHYGRPAERCHAIQIELNRALYVDEQSFRIKQPEFDELQRLLDALVVSLAALKL